MPYPSITNVLIRRRNLDIKPDMKDVCTQRKGHARTERRWPVERLLEKPNLSEP